MTDTTMEEFDFSGTYGAEVAKESKGGGEFAREVEFLRLDASPEGISQGADQAIIRVVTEYSASVLPQGVGVTKYTLPWITVPQHYAQTKQRPPYAKEGTNWPGKMYAVCRKGKVFAKRFNNQCYICDTLGDKARDRSWALAVEREQIIEDGRVVGYRDKTRQVSVFGADGKPVVESQDGDKKTYAKKTVPAYVLLNFGYKNFFGALEGQASYRQTVLDRDYVVKRIGMLNNNTNYTFIPLDPIPLDPATAEALGQPAGTMYNLGAVIGKDGDRPVTMAEAFYPEMPDLRTIVAERVSDDYFGRWFIPGWLPEGFDPNQAASNGGQVSGGVQAGWKPPSGFQPQQPATPAAPQPSGGNTEGPTAEALKALRERVTGGVSS